MKKCWILSNAFSATINQHTNNCASLEWNKLDHGEWFLWCAAEFNLLVFCWDSASMFIRQIGLLYFFVVSLSGSGNRNAILNEFGRVPSLSIQGISLRSSGVSSLNFGKISTVKTYNLGFSLLGYFLLLIQSHFLFLAYSGFLYALGSILV